MDRGRGACRRHDGIPRFEIDNRLAPIGALIAAVLGFCYFIQQQKLAETQLFKDLFTEFNTRYDSLNDPLELMRASGPWTPAQNQHAVDYLNLCAEEYFFYTQGYIHPEVWRAWCRGMLQYLDSPNFRSCFQRELATGSYYGLSEQAIRQGAA